MRRAINTNIHLGIILEEEVLDANHLAIGNADGLLAVS